MGVCVVWGLASTVLGASAPYCYAYADYIHLASRHVILCWAAKSLHMQDTSVSFITHSTFCDFQLRSAKTTRPIFIKSHQCNCDVKYFDTLKANKITYTKACARMLIALKF